MKLTVVNAASSQLGQAGTAVAKESRMVATLDPRAARGATRKNLETSHGPEPSMPELRVPLSAADHFVGDPAAAVTLVEYGDYQCPYCRAAHPVVINLLKRFGPDVVFAYRHFPLTTIHPLAKPAAETAEFAGSFGRFWEMHATLYASGPQLTFRTLLLIGDGFRLGADRLRKALVAGTYAAKVERDYAGGLASGVTGTPCFFINGHRHEGRNDETSLGRAIESARRAASAPAARLSA